MEQNEKHSQLLFSLIGSFEMSAMQFMGKIKNPMTDKLEKNMEQAQLSIDMLDMLNTKMKGNLIDYEEKFLINVLGQLKLNYLDEMEKEKQKPGTDSEEKDVSE